MLALATLGAAAASSYAEESAAYAAAGGAARVAEADLPDDGTCFQWDGVELANRSYCKPCLNGSYWDEFRDARAASRRAAATAAPVVVEMPYWLSGQLQWTRRASRRACSGCPTSPSSGTLSASTRRSVCCSRARRSSSSRAARRSWRS